MKHLRTLFTFIAVSALLATGTVRAATVTGTITDVTGTATTNARVQFQPLSNPQSESGTIITSAAKTVTATNGTFSVNLEQGDYSVLVNGRDNFQIAVPNDSNSYAISSLITTALTYSYTSPPSYDLDLASSTTPGVVRTDADEGSPIVYLKTSVDANFLLKTDAASLYLSAADASAYYLLQVAGTASNLTVNGTTTLGDNAQFRSALGLGEWTTNTTAPAGLTVPISVSDGGTGSPDAPAALLSLGAVQNLTSYAALASANPTTGPDVAVVKFAGAPDLVYRSEATDPGYGWPLVATNAVTNFWVARPDELDARWYGVVADYGTVNTDNTAALTAAIAAAKTTAIPVRLPPGRMLVSGSINATGGGLPLAKERFTLRGANPVRAFAFASSADQEDVSWLMGTVNDAAIIDALGTWGCTFENLAIGAPVAGSSTNGPQAGILLGRSIVSAAENDAGGHIINNVLATGTFKIAPVVTVAAEGLHVTDCTFKNAKEVGGAAYYSGRSKTTTFGVDVVSAVTPASNGSGGNGVFKMERSSLQSDATTADANSALLVIEYAQTHVYSSVYLWSTALEQQVVITDSVSPTGKGNYEIIFDGVHSEAINETNVNNQPVGIRFIGAGTFRNISIRGSSLYPIKSDDSSKIVGLNIVASRPKTTYPDSYWLDVYDLYTSQIASDVSQGFGATTDRTDMLYRVRNLSQRNVWQLNDTSKLRLAFSLDDSVNGYEASDGSQDAGYIDNASGVFNTLDGVLHDSGETIGTSDFTVSATFVVPSAVTSGRPKVALASGASSTAGFSGSGWIIYAANDGTYNDLIVGVGNYLNLSTNYGLWTFTVDNLATQYAGRRVNLTFSRSSTAGLTIWVDGIRRAYTEGYIPYKIDGADFVETVSNITLGSRYVNVLYSGDGATWVGTFIKGVFQGRLFRGALWKSALTDAQVWSYLRRPTSFGGVSPIWAVDYSRNPSGRMSLDLVNKTRSVPTLLTTRVVSQDAILEAAPAFAAGIGSMVRDVIGGKAYLNEDGTSAGWAALLGQRVSASTAVTTNIIVTAPTMKVIGSGGAATPVTVSETGAFAGQIVTILGDAAITTDTVEIVDTTVAGYDLQLVGGAACVLGANDTLMLLYSGAAWVELGRSDN